MRLGLELGRVERLVTAIFGVSVFYGVYGVLGAAQVGAELHELRSPLDVVPLMPWTAAIYLFLYAQVLAPLSVIRDRGVLWRGLLCYALLVGIGTPFWWFYPVTVPREPVPVTDLWTWGLAVTRFIDPPTNCFPSMHVAESFCAAALVYRHDRRTLGRHLRGVGVQGAALLGGRRERIDPRRARAGRRRVRMASGVRRGGGELPSGAAGRCSAVAVPRCPQCRLSPRLR